MSQVRFYFYCVQLLILVFSNTRKRKSRVSHIGFPSMYNCDKFVSIQTQGHIYPYHLMHSHEYAAT